MLATGRPAPDERRWPIMKKQNRKLLLLSSLLAMGGVICLLHFLPVGYARVGDLKLVAPRLPADADVERLLEQVDVRPIDLSVWTINDWYMQGVLWDAFGNTPHEQAFDGVSTRNWTNTWVKCRDYLIAKAETQHLDATSLGACLDSARSSLIKGEESIPVAAYSAKYCGLNIWILVIKWGRDYNNPDGTIDGRMGHIRIEAFCCWNRKLITAATCM